jgi:hypothetical protein
MKKIIVRVKGGIGNQLFCYAAAKRLAFINHAELVIDNYTGFARDHEYKRIFLLDHFKILNRKANKFELKWPFERCWLTILKIVSKKKPFQNRIYLEQEFMDFDYRLLSLKVNETIYLDGYWQSEFYFKDIEHIIREDLTIFPPNDNFNLKLADEISKKNSVAIHVRWFDNPGSLISHNASHDYYKRAIEIMEQRLTTPHYYIFSDKPSEAKTILNIPEERLTLISHNIGDKNSYIDLWLMTNCKHFIIANSTFSWWGAWLGKEENKIVLSPNLKIEGKTAWGFKGLIPSKWEII